MEMLEHFADDPDMENLIVDSTLSGRIRVRLAHHLFAVGRSNKSVSSTRSSSIAAFSHVLINPTRATSAPCVSLQR